MSVKKRGQIHCRFRQTYEQTYLTPRTHIHTNENVHSENGNGESVYGVSKMGHGNAESVYGAGIMRGVSYAPIRSTIRTMTRRWI